MEQTSIALAALGIVGTLCAALIWLLKKLFTQNEDVLGKLSCSIDTLSDVLSNNDKRDLDFQKLVIKQLKDIESKTDRNYDAVINTQQAGTQVVENQTIVSKE